MGKIALALLSMVCICRADIISVSQSGSDTLGSWGVTDTATFGQTVTVPVGDITLKSFSFQLGGSDPAFGDIDGGPIDYKAFVYLWDGSEASGPALFDSGLQTFTPPPASSPASGFTAVTFTPNINVVAGQQYVMFLSTAGLQSGRPDSTIEWAADLSGPYADGDFVFLNNTDDPSLWTTAGWSSFGGPDLAFSAEFAAPASTVPEPGSIFLIVSMVGVFPLIRKRSKPL